MDKNAKIQETNIDTDIHSKNCKLSLIKNAYIMKLIFKYQNIANALKIIKINKSLQKNLGLSLTTYKIFSFYKKNKINMFDFKKLIKFSQNIKSKLKDFSSLEEINYDLSLCMLNDFYSNNNGNNLKKNNINIIDINMIYDDLYLLYSSLLMNFSFSFKINLFFSDKFFIDKIYLNKYYNSFLNKNKNFINGISLEIYDKNIVKNIVENNISLFTNNKYLDSSFYIKRIKFSKIKFSKDEMKLLQFFSGQILDEICFISCKFTLYSIEILSEFFNKEKNNLKKIVFNDCHINNHIIEKLIYWNEKDKEYSFIKSLLSNINELDLSKNKITDLGFNQLLLYYNSNNEYFNKKLYYLNLSNNKLKSESIKFLLNNNINCPLNRNNSKNNNEIILKDINEIEILKGLIYLDLSHNPLGDYTKFIFSWKNNTLTHLILNDCCIRNIKNEKYSFKSDYMNIDEDWDEEEIHSTSYTEKENDNDNELDENNISLGLINLLYLNISENQLSPGFLKFLFYNIPNLYTLFISSCYLENNSFEEIINTKREINIRKLVISHNQIDTSTIINLYEKNILKNVKELDLFDNNLRDEIVPYLIQKKNNIKLTKINIDLNFGIEKANNSLLYQNYMRYTKQL